MTVPVALAAAGVVSTTQRPPSDPTAWTQSDADGVVNSQIFPWMLTAKMFVVDRDHWQNGDGWIGPKPSPTEPGYQETMQLIMDGFTSRNALAEVVRRYTNGCVGHEPTWQLTPARAMKPGEKPTAAEQALIDEAQAALTVWWDRFNVAPNFWRAVYQMTWAQRSTLRLFVSRDAFQPVAGTNGQRGVAVQSDLESALALVLLDVPDVQAAAVYVDPDTKRETGVYLFEAKPGQRAAEITFVDRAGKTMLRTVGGDAPGSIPIDMAGHLTHHQMVRPTPLLTEQGFELQRALNLSMTVIPRALVTAAFLERWIMNAKLPGKFVDDGNGGTRYEPDPNFKMGPGHTTSLQGREVEDQLTGKTEVLSPDVKWREPIGVDAPGNAADRIYAKLLEECDQAHVLLVQDALPSGRSRREARADYKNSLNEGKHPIIAGGRWLVGAALALAEYLMGKPGRYSKTLRPRFDIRVDEGPLEPEDRAQNLAEWKEGARSLESVMTGAGIPDPAAEQQQIQEEAGARLALSERQAEVVRAWVDNDVPMELALELAGVDDELAERILAEMPDPSDDNRTPGDPDTNPDDPSDTPPGGDDDATDPADERPGDT